MAIQWTLRFRTNDLLWFRFFQGRCPQDSGHLRNFVDITRITRQNCRYGTLSSAWPCHDGRGMEAGIREFSPTGNHSGQARFFLVSRLRGGFPQGEGSLAGRRKARVEWIGSSSTTKWSIGRPHLHPRRFADAHSHLAAYRNHAEARLTHDQQATSVSPPSRPASPASSSASASLGESRGPRLAGDDHGQHRGGRHLGPHAHLEAGHRGQRRDPSDLLPHECAADALISGGLERAPDAERDRVRYSGDRAFVIKPASDLPPITAPVTIDGTTQPGYAGQPVVELDGESSGVVNGLQIEGASGSTIRGLDINSFSEIGGTVLEGTGIVVQNATNVVIAGNYLGTNPSGKNPAGNYIGIQLNDSSGITIGGTTSSDRNVISASGYYGIQIESDGTAPAAHNLIEGNYLGYRRQQAPPASCWTGCRSSRMPS